MAQDLSLYDYMICIQNMKNNIGFLTETVHEWQIFISELSKT